MQLLPVNVKKILFVVLAVCGVMLTYMGSAPNFKHNTQLPPLPKISKNASSITKYILYWSPFWHVKDYDMGSGSKPFQKCEYKNCYATYNKSMLPLEKFDALLFHASTYNKKIHGVPWIRFPHQKYVFMNIEAPMNICPNLRPYNSYFNWTLTYRFDSDIVRRHGELTVRKTKYSMPSPTLLKNKTKLVVWFVSHCSTSSKREYLVKEIQKLISIDIYGRCGPFRCSRHGAISDTKCYDMIERKYKFYLSFENSYCRDYASEKLYNILKRDIIPIVYGGSDYKVIAPPKSVINVADFQSTQQLVDYLKYLDEHQDEYLKYFEWKKKYRIVTGIPSSTCQICKKLHEPIKQSIYYDIQQWWWVKNNSATCITGKWLPKIVKDLLPKS